MGKFSCLGIPQGKYEGSGSVVVMYNTSSTSDSYSNSDSTVNYYTKIIDTHNCVPPFSAGTGWRFVTKVPGIYRVNAGVKFTTNVGTGGNNKLKVYTQPTTTGVAAVYKVLADLNKADSTNVGLGLYGTCLVELQVGDKMWVTAVSNYASVNLNGAASDNYIDIKLEVPYI